LPVYDVDGAQGRLRAEQMSIADLAELHTRLRPNVVE
jgi:hypothetical protein